MTKKTILCYYCSQKLNVPVDVGKIKVKCPSCSKSFQWQHDADDALEAILDGGPLAKLNPFNELLRSLVAKHTESRQRHSLLVRAVQWFNSTNETTLLGTVSKQREHLTELRSQLNSLRHANALLQQQQNELVPCTNSFLHLLSWFSDAQRQLRKKLQGLREASERAIEELYVLSGQITSAEQKLNGAESALAQFKSFDRSDKWAALDDLQESISLLQKEIGRMAAERNSLEEKLKPVLAQIERAEELRKHCEERRQRAAELSERLSAAHNSYQRAMLHKECEALLGVGSPQKVLAQADYDLKRITSSYEKSRKRAKELAEHSMLPISAVVIDGINVCYDGNKFIGLVALIAIMPSLTSRYEVTVVFDASIRHMLKSNDTMISSQLGEKVRVHVVASSGGKADETVLDIASSNSRAFVLSNNRFIEFGDKPVVKEQRVLRHEIVGGSIMVHALGINVKYR